MNSNVQIISKGLYRGTIDKSFPVKVKEYVFARQDEKKSLLLRFFNDSQLNITAIHFWLVQKNSHGEQIGKEKISLEGIYCAQGAIFVPASGFFVDDKCADFDVEMISAFSGEYEYKTKNGEIFVQYPIEYEQTAVVKKRAHCVQHKKLNKKVKFSSAINARSRLTAGNLGKFLYRIPSSADKSFVKSISPRYTFLSKPNERAIAGSSSPNDPTRSSPNKTSAETPG